MSLGKVFHIYITIILIQKLTYFGFTHPHPYPSPPTPVLVKGLPQVESYNYSNYICFAQKQFKEHCIFYPLLKYSIDKSQRKKSFSSNSLFIYIDASTKL